jgi:hypothetical protein
MLGHTGSRIVTIRDCRRANTVFRDPESGRSYMYGIIESWRRENEMAPMHASKYRGDTFQRSVVDELFLEQDCLSSGVCWITPRTRYTLFVSPSRIVNAISIPRRPERKSRATSIEFKPLYLLYFFYESTSIYCGSRACIIKKLEPQM